jgi:hypothetical protein
VRHWSLLSKCAVYSTLRGGARRLGVCVLRSVREHCLTFVSPRPIGPANTYNTVLHVDIVDDSSIKVSVAIMSRWFLGPALPADPLPAADELAASESQSQHENAYCLS